MNTRAFGTVLALALLFGAAACGGDDDAGTADGPVDVGDSPDADGDESATEPDDAEAGDGAPTGSLTFRGETFELTSSSCGAAPEDGVQWFAGADDDAGDIRVRHYGSGPFDIVLRVSESGSGAPFETWENYLVPEDDVDATEDEAIAGTAELSAVAGTDAEGDEVVEFEFSC